MTNPDKHIEPLIEINNQAVTQNEEWLSEDLTVYFRPRRIFMNIGLDGTKTVQITFDSGSTWTDFSTSKKFDFNELIEFTIDPNDQINFRVTDGSGATIQHCHAYMAG